jgi:hypothetical protein
MEQQQEKKTPFWMTPEWVATQAVINYGFQIWGLLDSIKKNNYGTLCQAQRKCQVVLTLRQSGVPENDPTRIVATLEAGWALADLLLVLRSNFLYTKKVKEGLVELIEALGMTPEDIGATPEELGIE